MHHHLVDDHLGEQRQCQPHQLQRKRAGQHIAPYALVPEQLRHEPAQSESRIIAPDPVGVDYILQVRPASACGAEVALPQLAYLHRCRSLDAALQQRHPILVGVEQQREPRSGGIACLCRVQPNRQRQLPRQCGFEATGTEFAFEPQLRSRTLDHRARNRRRIALREQRRVECNAMKQTERRKQPAGYLREKGCQAKTSRAARGVLPCGRRSMTTATSRWIKPAPVRMNGVLPSAICF